MVVSGSCPMAPVSEATSLRHMVWLESHSHPKAQERTRDDMPGLLEELPKRQGYLGRIEMGKCVGRGQGLQERLRKDVHGDILGAQYTC